MSDEDIVKFGKHVPSIELILETVREISGLQNIVLNDRKDILVHPDFTKRQFFIYADDCSVSLVRGWDDPWYLLDATISALIMLGGKYNGELSKWGQQKWINVKDNYPDVVDPSQFKYL